jgi:hypothetical protein
MLLRLAVIGLNHGRTYSLFARDGRNPSDSCKGASGGSGGTQGSAKVQIGAELRCKGGKVNDKTGRGVAEAEEITEYRVGRTEERQVQRCKSADGRWKSGKVRGREDYRVQSTELKGMR